MNQSTKIELFFFEPITNFPAMSTVTFTVNGSSFWIDKAVYMKYFITTYDSMTDGMVKNVKDISPNANIKSTIGYILGRVSMFDSITKRDPFVGGQFTSKTRFKAVCNFAEANDNKYPFDADLVIKFVDGYMHNPRNVIARLVPAVGNIIEILSKVGPNTFSCLDDVIQLRNILGKSLGDLLEIRFLDQSKQSMQSNLANGNPTKPISFCVTLDKTQHGVLVGSYNMFCYAIEYIRRKHGKILLKNKELEMYTAYVIELDKIACISLYEDHIENKLKECDVFLKQTSGAVTQAKKK